MLKSEIETVSEAVEIINYRIKLFRLVCGGGAQLVATGHVQIGLLKDRT